jgi:uncharacterized membrane protein YoaK (UPF0700 family)
MNIKKIVVATVIALGLASTAQAAKVTALDKSMATGFCVTAAAGNRVAMHNSIKASGYSSKYVTNNIKCNGASLLSFVENNGKNSASMLKMLDRTQTSVSITDLASTN